jgi:hypothetical protein
LRQTRNLHFLLRYDFIDDVQGMGSIRWVNGFSQHDKSYSRMALLQI